MAEATAKKSCHSSEDIRFDFFSKHMCACHIMDPKTGQKKTPLLELFSSLVQRVYRFNIAGSKRSLSCSIYSFPGGCFPTLRRHIACKRLGPNGVDVAFP